MSGQRIKNQLAENLAAVRGNMEKAARLAGRKASDTTLVAVSKKQPDARIDEGLAAGLRVFGENRVQEAISRWQSRRGDVLDLELRLIGRLQTNKAADAVGFFDVIESLDREKLARVLADEMAKQNRRLPCLVQVNTGEEEQKAGIVPSEVLAFVDFCRHDLGLEITGLMCIPPLDEDAVMHFGLLRVLAEKAGLEHLSMGMSRDYAEAIGLGATHIRVGSALFGERIGS